MIEPVQTLTKQCPICAQDLPLTEYGVCRARKDGRNLYCKSCIRKKVSASRRAFKAYKSVRHQYVADKTDSAARQKELPGPLPPRRHYVVRQVNKMTPVERVREAIRNGARTQKEIAQGTKLGKDEIGDALASLLLWTREIRTEVVESHRIYLINDSSPELMQRQENLLAKEENNEELGQLPPRKRDVQSSFSVVQDLMPGKRPEGETERPPGWVAA